MCLSLKPTPNILKQALSMYYRNDEDSLLLYFVHQAIAINKPLSDIFIADFRQHPPD
jgi:hypothetical protein